MSEPREPEMPEEDGATLIAPRFDEEETVLAQPVVPLEAEDAPQPAAPAPYAARPRAARRQWPLALILVSALAGSVLGGAGLYVFQKHLRSGAAPAPAEIAQPQPLPTVEQAAEAAPVSSEPAEEPAPVIEAAAPRDEEVEERPDNDDDVVAPPPARAPTADGAPKRDKKAEREDDEERRPRAGRAPRAEDDDDSERPAREARRVDTITYPTRREQRRAERQAARRERRAARNVDRVRAIFEGQP